MALGWFDAVAHELWPDDETVDDLDDWLEGNDTVLTERINDRRRDLLLEGGGEIG